MHAFAATAAGSVSDMPSLRPSGHELNSVAIPTDARCQKQSPPEPALLRHALAAHEVLLPGRPGHGFTVTLMRVRFMAQR